MRAVGRYRLVEQVGRGGAGAVWRALDPSGRRVAVKLLHAGALAGERERQRFAAEVQGLLRVRHPQVATLLDAGSEGGEPFLVLEHVDGQPLAARLEREGPLPPRAAGELVRRLALGLAHCHAQGILHRDLKPENVLLRATTGEPVLIDFGLARDLLVGDSQPGLTAEGTLLGSPGYWAPEQARGERAAIGPWTDVFGLGGVLFAALTGAGPIEAEGLLQALHSLSLPPAPPSSRRPGLPPELDAITLRCLARQPGQRYPDMASLAADLQRWLEGNPRPRAPRRALLGLALGGAGAGALLLTLGRDAPPGGPAPVAGAAAIPSSPVGAASGPTPSPWVVRLRSAREPVPRPAVGPETSGWRQAADDEERAGEVGLSADTLALLEQGAAAGDARAQLALARRLLTNPAAEAQARVDQLLWAASRPPRAEPQAGLILALRLAEREPAAARALLDEAATRTPLAHAPHPDRLWAAAALLALGGPGDLAAAIVLLREREPLGGLPDRGPLAPLFQGLAGAEGWGGPVDPGGAREAWERCLARPGPARAAALTWLRHAAVAGEPGARALVASQGLPRPDPEALDPRDLLALEGLRAVAAPQGELDARGAQRARLEALLELRRSPAAWAREGLPPLRELALDLEPLATWAMARCHLEGWGDTPPRPEPGLAWALVAGLSGPEREGQPWARLAAARVMLFAPGFDPGTTLRWIEPAPGARLADDDRLEAELWLALAAVFGRGRERDLPGGLERAWLAFEEAQQLDLLTGAPRVLPELERRFERAARSDAQAAALRAVLGREETTPAQLRRAARARPATRALLEDAAREALLPSSRTGGRARLELGILLLEEGRPDEARPWLMRAAEDGRTVASAILARLERGEDPAGLFDRSWGED